MAGGVRSILIKFLGESSGLARSLGDVDGKARSLSDRFDLLGKRVGEAEGLGGKLKAGWSGLGDVFGSTAGKMTIATAGVGAVATVAAKSVTAFEDSTLAVGKFRDATGTTSEEASRFVEVFDDLGIGAEAGQVAMGRFAKALGADATAFDQYGVSVVRANDGTIDMAATFVNAVDALNRIKDPAQRAAAGAAMFGRGWQSMAEVVSSGAPALKQALESVQPSKVFSDADIQAGRDVRDAFDALADAGQGLMLTLGKALAPVVSELAPILADVVDKAGPAIEAIGELLANAFRALAPLIEGVTTVLGPLITAFGKVTGAAADAVEAVRDFFTIDPEGSLSSGFDASAKAIRDAKDAAADASVAAQDLGDDMERLADQVGKSNDAAVASKWDAYSRSLDAVEKAHQAAEYEARRQADAEAELTRQMEDAKRAADELFSAERARFDVQFRQEEATNQAAASVQAYGELANSGKASFLALAAAQRDVQQAALSQADAVLAAAENTAELSGQTLTAAQKTDVWRKAMLDFANSLPDWSPLKKQILDMANAVDGIPDSKAVAVSAPGADQAVTDLTDVRMEQDKIEPTTETTTEVKNQVLSIQLLAAIRKIQDDINRTKVVVTPVVNVGNALARVNELRRALDAIPLAASRASAAAIASVNSSAAAINRIRAGSVPTSGGRVI